MSTTVTSAYDLAAVQDLVAECAELAEGQRLEVVAGTAGNMLVILGGDQSMVHKNSLLRYIKYNIAAVAVYHCYILLHLPRSLWSRRVDLRIDSPSPRLVPNLANRI